jgi:LacI family transcriptional regulator
MTAKSPAVRRPTLQDVAEAANVSMMTVSRALNGHDRVSEETRNRVLGEAARLGYRPSSTARTLRSNQSFLIGVFSPNMMMPLHSELVLGAQEAAAEYGYKLLLDVDVSSPFGRNPFVSDGDIVMGSPPDQRRRGPHFDRMRTVSMMGYVEGLDSSMTDLSRATYYAMQHLQTVGYQRVGLIQLPESPAQAGYDQALAEGNLDASGDLIHTVGPDGSGIREAIAALTARGTNVDALVVVSVAATPVALRELRSRGINVGTELGFVGTEGSRGGWSDLMNPAITTIQVPGYDLGAAAARRLIERLRGDASPARKLEFSSDIVIRESTPGPPTKKRRD